LVRDGRTYWKVKNENNNFPLKIRSHRWQTWSRNVLKISILTTKRLSNALFCVKTYFCARDPYAEFSIWLFDSI